MTDAAVEPTGLAPSSKTTPPVPRRRGWVFAAAAAVVIALLVTLIVIVTRPHPFTASDARRAELTVLIGGTLFLPNGTTTTLGIDVRHVDELTVMPDGFLATVDPGPGATTAGTDLWLIHRGGSYQEIATSADSDFEVSTDGRTAVVRSVDAQNNVALRSIDIETGAQLHTYGDGNQHVIAVRGDWALISDDGDGSSPQASVAWNIRTGTVVPFASSVGVTAWGVTPDGEVLRSIDTEHAPPLTPTHACYDLVAPDHTATPAVIPTKPTGYCARLDVTDATMSPDGSWVVLIPGTQSPGHGVVAVRAADLHAGRWAPVNLDQAGGMSRPLFWDSATSFIAPYTNDADDAGYERCSVDGRCHDLGIPGDAVIVRSLGG
ncbi:MAG TPA: hypothetical protein VFR11_07610 [Micromonosporaceae bacterium]|nr:hypothetical protein [Micromonosporaceae bacterium]